ncbi:MAG: Flp pilus assembly complex ATPase component TadA [Deltaproteobacteria bacterium]|nr:Flp pilus assembly complex ATPase component TadA [Deltaproteobacteria bacterium]
MNNNIIQTPANHSIKKTKEERHILIGELLIKEGLIKKEDLEKALEIQRQEKEIQQLPLGQILLKIQALSESDLKDLMNHPELRKDLGTLAIQKGYITKEQLIRCLQKKPPHQLLGEVLIEEGLLRPQDLGRLIKEQTGTPRIGELALRSKLINEKDLAEALRLQKSARRLGEILCDMNVINPLDLNNVLKKHNKQEELSEILLNLLYINTEQLNIARQEPGYGTTPLEEILIKKKFITQSQLLVALSKQYNIPFKELDGFGYSPDEKKRLTSIISQKYAEKNTVLPISLHDNHLELALFRPEDTHLVYQLKGMYSNYYITCVLTTKDKFRELFEVLYDQSVSNLIPSDPENPSHQNDTELDAMELDLSEDLDGQIDEGPAYGASDVEAEEIVNYIIKYGIMNGASDIHIEQDRKGVTLRYRLDGVLRESNVGWLKKRLTEKAPSVISRIKIMANLDIAEKRLPQDGVFRINYYDKEEAKKRDLDFRVATCRAITGENVVIRILDSRKANVGLENLNHSPHVLKPFKTLLKSSAGMVLVTGPTGSGKSSTLYAALQYIYNPGIKIITAEDPIEYNFPGIMQTQANSKINLNFARLMRSFLRLDPDVIFIGEMRDEETAKIGFDAAQTGHLLLSTLHTNDAVASISRLLDLKVEYGQIASSLLCVLAQRLVRRICPSCMREYIPEEDEWGMLFKNYPAHLTFHKGTGCEKCNFSGYSGRTLLSEIFVVDKEIAHALNNGLDENGIKKLAFESGMKTMIEDGLLKLDQTTLSEIIRMIPHEMLTAFRSRNYAQATADRLIESMLTNHETPMQGASSGFHISDPRSEGAKIDLMKSRYESLVSKDGRSATPLNASLFRDFVLQSYHQIHTRFGCQGVTFHIEMNHKAGRPEISAVPDD